MEYWLNNEKYVDKSKGYNVYTVEAYKGSASSSDNVIVYVDEKLNNNVFDQEVLVYPKPKEEFLNVEVIDFGENFNILIFNLKGRVIY